MKKKEYIILIIIIAVLSAYLVSKKRGSVHYSLPVLSALDGDSIARLVIKKAGDEVTLKKSGENWLIVSEDSNAEKTAVDLMVNTLKELTLTSLVSESENYSMYDLDEENGIVVQAFDVNDNIVRKITVGKTPASFGYTLVTVNDDPNIYHARGSIRGQFDKSALGFRDKGVMSFDEEIDEITFNDGAKDTLIARVPVEAGKEGGDNKEAEQRWRTKDGMNVSKAKIDDIINTLKNLRCDKYFDAQKEDLKDHVFAVSVKGKKTYSIKLFGKEGALHKATSSENRFPFLLPERTVKKIKMDITDLIEK